MAVVSPKNLGFNAGNFETVFGQFGNVCEDEFCPQG